MGSQTIAEKTVIGNTTTLNWLLSDQVNSTTVTVNADGTWNSAILYTAFGEIRSASGNTPTQYRFTSQLADSYIKLDWYNSRWYDSDLGHFVQPDSIIPGLDNSSVPTSPDAWNRFEYAKNNPIRYNDPTGHCIFGGIDTIICVVVLAAVSAVIEASPAIAEAAPQVAEAAPEVENAAVGLVDDLAPAAEQGLENFSESVSPVVEKAGADLEDVIGGKSEPANIDSGSDLNVKEPRGGVYKLVDPKTGDVMRTGRSGNLLNRMAQHARNPNFTKFDFRIMFKTDDYSEQRGLEQVAHETYNPAWDKINAISPNNTNITIYKAAADTFLKKLLGQ